MALSAALQMLANQIERGLLRQRPTWVAAEIAGFGVPEFRAQTPALDAHLAGMGATRAEPEAVADLAQRATDHQAPRIRDQHVVSKVLLRQFCVPVKNIEKLMAFNLQWGQPHPRTPRQVGKIVDIVKIDSESTERIWRQVETRLHAALLAVHNGQLLNHPSHVDTIKRAITLHFARRQEVSEFNERSWREQLEQHREVLRAQRWFMRAALEERYGRLILPDGAQVDEIALDLLMEGTTRLYESGSMFRLRVEDEFNRGERIASQVGLKVMEAGGGEFLIGDTPVVVLGPGGVSGVRNVGLANAVTLALPLSPTHMAALHTIDEYVQIPASEVDDWNRRQVLQAKSHVYYRPGAPLATFITVTRAPAGNHRP
jgi:hypothetical protein